MPAPDGKLASSSLQDHKFVPSQQSVAFANAFLSQHIFIVLALFSEGEMAGTIDLPTTRFIPS